MNFKDPYSDSRQEIPDKYKANIERCKYINPNFTFMIWSGKSCLELIQKKYPSLLDKYKSLTSPISKCDFVRLLILHRFGGIYSDCDRICQYNYSGLINTEDYDVILGIIPSRLIRIIQNDIIIAKQGSDFLMHCAKHVVQSSANNEPMRVNKTAGPEFITKMYDTYTGPDKIKLLHHEIQPCSMYRCSIDIVDAYSYSDMKNLSWMSERDRKIYINIINNLELSIIVVLVIIIIILVFMVVVLIMRHKKEGLKHIHIDK